MTDVIWRQLTPFTYSIAQTCFVKPAGVSITEPPSIPSTTPPRRTHLDHCIEILRQDIMCPGDVAMVTYDWARGIEDPFSTSIFFINAETSRSC
ncbi:hypothetical protein CY34DRAFT_804465 [Suillus luteus UH-Slu-Lm8-n1]|uniref:Uncharacterized protein n=1 Tax=Suillus luteus UH-Slu-Lm8-n1 TaxID=930992 RepID=A0A0D0BIA2_9AGAM|nr:hypothetical protein CY34DRAFT_804465 [Suillus luteus UH-Slu-Lm8-n1]